jgi:hypothetical protein
MRRLVDDYYETDGLGKPTTQRLQVFTTYPTTILLLQYRFKSYAYRRSSSNFRRASTAFEDIDKTK